MDLKLSTLLCISLFFSTILTPTLSELCNPTDKKVLFEIKTAFNNPYILSSWKSDADCCTDWYNVECDPNTNRINSLTIFTDDRLTGQIPAQVGDLPYLETLVLRKLPNLTGPIQPSIVKLKHLKMLRLSWNGLSGSVPDFLSQLKNLTFLELNYNNFTGSVPSSLSKLPNLLALHLDRNQLTGNIPSSYGKFVGTVPDLFLSHNKLTGKIPTSFANMNFDRIDLSRNMLEGDASMIFGMNKTTQIVDLSRNMLEFDLSKVVFSTSLISLDLNHNRMTGSIPEKLTQLDNLQLFNVSYNRLCGQIPVGGKLQSFDTTSYFHNRCLCGAPLPSC
uniref:Polygalacturonase-inhibiting protein n=1 Tax=Fragaria ananassa TaxID=3747 RepID=A7Y2Y8_FRAAN|nr:polygalacturonase-inhibiting protein [Fragaria x ananassa]ABV04089.1 polygalacturonase-inhibiting protein [Fragaria x ananassa]